MTGILLYCVTCAMLIMGVAVHWLKSLITMRNVKDMQPLSVSVYWLRFWPESLVALFSGIAGYAFLIDTGNLTSINAFGIGYMANSLADIIGNRVQAMIVPTTPQPHAESRQ